MSGTGIEDRVALISRIVRESLTIRTDDPEFFRRTAKRWGMPPASFNRLKDTGRAGHVNYRIAEMGLGLPRGLFLAIREGDYETVRARAAELEDLELRSLILTTLNLPGGSPPRKRTPRKAGNGPRWGQYVVAQTTRTYRAGSRLVGPPYTERHRPGGARTQPGSSLCSSA